MSERTLEAEADSVSLNHERTVGIMTYQSFHDDANTVIVSPEYLKLWAEAVADAYDHDSAVEIVCSDGVPLIARQYDRDDDATPDLGIGVAPKLERTDSPADGWESDDE